MSNPDIDRLREIKSEMEALLAEAKTILRHEAEEWTYDRAKAYWIAYLSMALDNDHDFIGGIPCTFEDTIAEMDDESSEDDGEDDEDDEDEDEDEDDA